MANDGASTLHAFSPGYTVHVKNVEKLQEKRHKDLSLEEIIFRISFKGLFQGSLSGECPGHS